MNTRKQTTFPALLLAGLLTTLTGCSIAQSAPAGSSAGTPATTAAHGSMHGRHDPAQMQARMNKRMDELKAKLKITPAQEAAWTSFTTAMQPMQHAGGMDMRANHDELSKLPTPERLDRMRALHTQHMSEMSTRMSQRADATKAFYNVLSAEQKKTFDDAFARGMGGHRMSKHGDHRGDHRG